MVTQREIQYELYSAASLHPVPEIRDGMAAALYSISEHPKFNAAQFYTEVEFVWYQRMRVHIADMALDGFIERVDRSALSDLTQSKIRANLQAIGRS